MIDLIPANSVVVPPDLDFRFVAVDSHGGLGHGEKLERRIEVAMRMKRLVSWNRTKVEYTSALTFRSLARVEN